MDVNINGSTQPVLLRLVDNAKPSLLGRDILEKFKLPWSEVFAAKKEIDQTLERVKYRDVIAQSPELFDNSTIGKLCLTKVNLRVDPTKPVLMKARTVLFAITEKHEVALNKLVDDGIIRKVEHSQWDLTTVPVAKHNGSDSFCVSLHYSILTRKTKCCCWLFCLINLMLVLRWWMKFQKLRSCLYKMKL